MHRRALLAAVLSSSAVLSAGAAHASPQTTETAGAAEALAAVEAVAPNQHAVIEPGLGLVAEGELAEVALPEGGAEAVELTRLADGAEIGVGLPEEAPVGDAVPTEDGTVVYEAADADSADLAVQVLRDGSVQIQTVIPSVDAPHEYTYELEVPSGATVELDDNGGVVALAADGSFLGGFAPPWAKDADGRDLATSYRVEGVSVVQTIAPADPSAYPVVADPWLGIALIDDVNRSYVSGYGYRYYVYPSWWGRVGAGTAARWAAWTETKSYYPYGLDKPNLADQFYCHFDGRLGTFAKGSWNLEAWRRDVSYAATIAALCNP